MKKQNILTMIGIKKDIKSNQGELFQFVNRLLLGVSIFMLAGNELCQRLVSGGLLEYQNAFGYLSDIFAVPFTASLIIMIKGKDKIWLWPLWLGIIYSLLEVIIGIYDPYDFLCYWSGTLLTYGAIKTGLSEQSKKIFLKI